jgi:L-threonylcarbamoyladenylate synthase
MGKVIKLNPHRIQTKIIDEAARIIKRGGIIVYPTDTIYGIGCDAFNKEAVRKIFRIKRRDEHNPMLVLVNNIMMLRELVDEITPLALALSKEYWPGPLTMIFKANKNIHRLLKSDEGKIGIRIPDNRFCLKLIEECHTPIVSTSANISGQNTLNESDTLIDIFGDKVDLFIDAGKLPPSLPSTVVDVSGKKLKITREGAIPVEDLKVYDHT